MTRRSVLLVAAAFSVVVAACAIPMLTPQQNAQYCAVEVRGPSGAPLFAQGALLDPGAEARMEALPDAALAGTIAGSFALRFFLYPLGGLIPWSDPRPAANAAIRAAHACEPDKLPRPSAVTEFRHVLDTTHAEVLARALEAELDAPRPACTSARSRRDPAAAPDGHVEIEVVAVVAGCLVDRVQYRVDVRWTLKNAQTGGPVAKNTTQCVLTSSREVVDWLDHPALARAELENALAATGQRVARELVVGYPPAAPCVLHADAGGTVVIR